MLEIGTKAPDFILPDQDSNKISLSQFLAFFVIIYFYPKDDTAGCTAEACAIRDSYGEFLKAGVTVLGISKDSPESHKQFREKYGLPFTLLSDPNREVIKTYGADGMFGTKRITYIVNPKGIIAKAYPNVEPAGHAKEILGDILALAKI